MMNVSRNHSREDFLSSRIIIFLLDALYETHRLNLCPCSCPLDEIIYASFCSCRMSLLFRLMPQSNAILDCSPIAAAGHIIPQSFVPISVSQFMDDLSTEEMTVCNRVENNYVSLMMKSKESLPF